MNRCQKSAAVALMIIGVSCSLPSLGPRSPAVTARGPAGSGIADQTLTYEDLVSLVNQHSLTRLEDLLAFLPEQYFNQFVLMHDSRSTQGASFDLPRVISFGNDASLLLSWNGDANQEGYERLEIVQFRQNTSKFELRQISFPTSWNGLKAPSFSAANPRECLGCHSISDPADPRPNWEPYNQWPGAYGEDANTIDANHASATFKPYLRFLALARENPRYKRLGANYNYKDEAAGLVHFLTPESLNSRVNRWNFLRLVRIMRGAPHFEAYKFMAAGALASCGYALGGYFPEPLADALTARHRALTETKTELNGGNPPEAGEWALALDQIFEPLGFDTRDWSTDFNTRGEFSSGNRYNDADDPDSSWLGKLVSGDAELEPYFELVNSKNPDFGGWISRGFKTGKDCEGLRAESRARFSAFLAPNASPAAIEAFVKGPAPLARFERHFPAPMPSGSPPLLRRCASCHSTGARAVPSIPFDDGRALAARLGTKAGSGERSLLEEIRYRLDPAASGSDRMPPSGASPSSRAALLNYLQNL